MKKEDKANKAELLSKPASNPDKHSYMASGMIFTIPKKYEIYKVIGKGAYGIVVSGVNKNNGEKIAIKKIPNAFVNLLDAKRILREIKILHSLQHENIISLKDVIKPDDSTNYEDIYLVTDLLGTDLHKTIYSQQQLTNEHIQYFLYQLLRGLLYIHSAGIIHRDLKPSNLLLTQECDLKICDFGLSRGLQHNFELTEYVVTRWYRAPEIILNASDYNQAVDMWSVGCIMAELFGRKPLLPGNDYLDQMKRIIERTGTPCKEDIDLIESEEGKKFIKSLPVSPYPDWAQVFPNANKLACDLLSRLLAFNPKKRITVQESMRHPYFVGLHNVED